MVFSFTYLDLARRLEFHFILCLVPSMVLMPCFLVLEQDKLLEGGSTELWPLWLHTRQPGTLSLNSIIYYESDITDAGLKYRTVRMSESIQVFPLTTLWCLHLCHEICNLLFSLSNAMYQACQLYLPFLYVNPDVLLLYRWFHH